MPSDLTTALGAIDEPFTPIYSKLWDMAEAVPELTAIIPEGNRIRYDKPNVRIPEPKLRASSADTPELLLAFGNIDGTNTAATSSECEIVRSYIWRIHSGDSRVQIIHALQWVLFVAMQSWKTELTALQWKGLNYVKHFQLENAIEGISDSETNRGVKGWTNIWECQIRMRFRLDAVTATP